MLIDQLWRMIGKKILLLTLKFSIFTLDDFHGYKKHCPCYYNSCIYLFLQVIHCSKYSTLKENEGNFFLKILVLWSNFNSPLKVRKLLLSFDIWLNCGLILVLKGDFLLKYHGTTFFSIIQNLSKKYDIGFFGKIIDDF